MQDGHGSGRFDLVLRSPVSNPVLVPTVLVSNSVSPFPIPRVPTAAIPGPKGPRGVFFGNQKRPKTVPDTPKQKTSKTDVKKPFQELSLKPAYSSHRKNAHSRILVPKGANRAKFEFPGPNVRVKIRFHLVPVPSCSSSIRFHLAPGSTRFRFQMVQLTVLQFGSRFSCRHKGCGTTRATGALLW